MPFFSPTCQHPSPVVLSLLRPHPRRAPRCLRPLDSRLDSTSSLSPVLSHPLLPHLPWDFCRLSTPLALLPASLHYLFPFSNRLALGHSRRLSRINPRPSMASLWNRARLARYARPLCISLGRHLVGHSSHGPQCRPTPLQSSLYPSTTPRHRP
jgi:hypothetical protein